MYWILNTAHVILHFCVASLKTFFLFVTVRVWRNVELHFSPSLGRPYVSGRSCLSSPLEVVLPLSVDSSVSHAYIQSLFEHLQIGGQNFNR